MKVRTIWAAGILLVPGLAGWGAPALAQNLEPRAASGDLSTQPASRPSTAEAPEVTAVTHHSITIRGHELRYTATAGFLPLRNEARQIQANVFYVAYVKDDELPANRPVTFAFNGGPGAASVWLHLGAMGPKRVLLAENGTALPKTVKLVDNEFTWLTFTDMVFIDPVGSGYSAVAPGVDAKQFYGIQGDVQSVGQFIRLYVSQQGRWASPKFLAGESYGTTRAAGLARYLLRKYAMDLNGLILLSSALDFQTFVYSDENDLPYVVSLPTYTAVAWYHRKLVPELQASLDRTLAQVEQWTLDEYAPALARGDDLPEPQRKAVIESLHRFTSLSETFIARSDLRVRSSEFAKALLRDEDRVVGILDGRVTGYAIDPTTSSIDYDPSLALVSGPFTAALQAYLHTELGFQTDREYVYLATQANQSWNWGSAAEGFVNVTDDLRLAMTENPNLRVFAGMGCFDLTTSYFGQKYTLNHLGLASPLQEHIRLALYPSGHQIYTEESSLKKLAADAGDFVNTTFSPASRPPSVDG